MFFLIIKFSSTKIIFCALPRPDGGLDLVMMEEQETYLLDLETMTWREAIAGDVDMDLYAPTVQSGFDTFYLLGGYAAGAVETDIVHRYVPEDEAWVELEHTLQLGRRSAVAIGVPEEVANCVWDRQEIVTQTLKLFPEKLNKTSTLLVTNFLRDKDFPVIKIILP